MTENLITRYRPKSFDEVIGQASVVRSLQQIVKKKDAQIFLFSGPAGTGKTTLSRIVSKALGVDGTPGTILDHDAATKNGIDDMRAIQEILQYRPFGNSGKRAIILDECHSLSKNSWDSLLKVLEEPSKHVVWCFCTTNPSKVPQTIKSRCAKFDLKLVDDKDLGQLYDYVVEQEKLDIPGDVGDLLIKEAKGSPRQLLSNIVVARTAKTKKEAAELLKSAAETDATHELCQFLVYGNRSWSKAMLILKKLENDNPESIRIVVSAYLSKCALSAKDNDKAGMFLEMLDHFVTPYQSYEGIAPLLLSVGRAILT